MSTDWNKALKNQDSRFNIVDYTRISGGGAGPWVTSETFQHVAKVVTKVQEKNFRKWASGIWKSVPLVDVRILEIKKYGVLYYVLIQETIWYN